MTIWNEEGFELPVLAEATGPFCTRAFLEVAAGFDSGTPLEASSDDAFLPLRRVGEEIHFAGDPDITDYHSPLGDGSESLIVEVAETHAPARFVLDSLPDQAAKPLAAGLTGAGWDTQTRVHEVAAVVDLPGSFDEYLDDIGKKERHEVRRKRRRYQRMVGDVVHETHHGPGWALDEFVRLHRMAAGEKGDFMTESRRELFDSLVSLDGWRIDLLRRGDSATAVVVGYSDATGYYLYNSSYDPDLGQASPGVVLLGRMIEQAISEGLSRFDFLKGDESYKFRLGARERPLTEIVAVPGEGA